jgi:hypothetical protein
MKRLSFTLAALGFSSVSVFASLPTTSGPSEISIPQLNREFSLGVTGMFLQPTPNKGDTDFASFNSTTSSAAPNANPQTEAVEAGRPLNYGVDLGYIFQGTGNDFNLSYTHVSTNNFAQVTGPNQSNIPMNFMISLPDIKGFSIARPTLHYDINIVDLTAGQFINVGSRLSLHPLVGLRYASVTRDLNNLYIQTVPGHDDKLIVDESSDFDGIGPLAGLDANYYLGAGFGVVGKVDSALLVGHVDSKFAVNMAGSTNSNPGATRYIANFKYDAGSVHRIAPVVDAKLGADYIYLFNSRWVSSLKVEAGYQASHYFNVVDRIGGTAVVNSQGVSTIGATTRKTSDVGLNGPYLELSLQI